MISFVEGILEYVTLSSVVINVGGVGYELMIPASDLEYLPEIGEKVRLHTFLNINENTGVCLFGFKSISDLELFKQLITVNSVGPKSAQAMIGALGADAIRIAIVAEDSKTLAKAPGIGAKTASRIVLDLKDKIDAEAALVGLGDSPATAVSEASGLRKDAIEALVALGYSKTEATKAVKSVPEDKCDTVDSILSESLKFLF